MGIPIRHISVIGKNWQYRSSCILFRTRFIICSPTIIIVFGSIWACDIIYLFKTTTYVHHIQFFRLRIHRHKPRIAHAYRPNTSLLTISSRSIVVRIAWCWLSIVKQSQYFAVVSSQILCKLWIIAFANADIKQSVFKQHRTTIMKPIYNWIKLHYPRVRHFFVCVYHHHIQIMPSTSSIGIEHVYFAIHSKIRMQSNS